MKMLALSLVAVGAAVALTLAAGHSTSFVGEAAAGDPPPIAGTVSNGGRPEVLPSRTRQMLERFGLDGPASLLAVRDGRLFHRIAGTSRGTCYAVGDATDLGLITCSHGFPGRNHPLLDLSIYEIAKDGGSMPAVTPYRIQGVAVDGVAAVALLAPDGRVATRIPVVANTYLLTSPTAEPVIGIAALNAAGERVFSRSYEKTTP
jgi:hypothetical protein